MCTYLRAQVGEFIFTCATRMTAQRSVFCNQTASPVAMSGRNGTGARLGMWFPDHPPSLCRAVQIRPRSGWDNQCGCNAFIRIKLCAIWVRASLSLPNALLDFPDKSLDWSQGTEVKCGKSTAGTGCGSFLGNPFDGCLGGGSVSAGEDDLTTMLSQRTGSFEANAAIGTRNQGRASVQIFAMQDLQGGGAGVKSLADLGHILRGLLHGEGQARIHIRSLLRLLVQEHEPLSLLIVVLLPAQGQLPRNPLGATCPRVCPLWGFALLAKDM